MLIKTKISKEIEKDIILPFFRRNVSGSIKEYFAMITEHSVISMSISEVQTIVQVSPKWIKEGNILEAYENWECTSEEEFLNIHEETLKSLSLKPTLVNAANPDDLKGVNI